MSRGQHGRRGGGPYVGVKYNKMAGILQANLHKSRPAQDLMLHTMAERGIGLAIASEPSKVPKNHPCWFLDKGGKVVATWRETGDLPLFSKLEKGFGYIAVKWGRLVVIGVYILPKLPIDQYERRLDRITGCIRRHRSCPVLVVGDFNAHSLLWGGVTKPTIGVGRLSNGWQRIPLTY